MGIYFFEKNTTVKERLKRVDTFLIDFDNTLVDYKVNEYRALESLLKQINHYHKVDFNKVLDYYRGVNLNLWEKFERNEVSLSDIRKIRFTKLANRFNINFQPLELNNLYLENFVNKAEITPETLTSLRKLRSTFPRKNFVVLTNGIHDVQKGRMETVGITHFFDELVSSETVGVPKPNEKIFKKAVEVVDTEYHRCLMIGDSITSDIDGAKRIGMLNFLIDKEMKNNYSIKPDIVVDSFTSFAKYIYSNIE